VNSQILIEPHNTGKQRGELIRALSFLSQIGFMVAACILTGVLLGRFLDRVLGTSPWFLLFFSLSGAAAAFRSVLEMAKKI